MSNDLKYKHWFVCRNGKLIFDNRSAYRTNLVSLENRRGFLVLYDELESEPITKEDRAYYFKVLIGELYRHQAFYSMSQLEIHHCLMELFCGRYERVNGVWEKFVPSSSRLNRKEWREYVEKVEYFCGTMGIVLKPLNVYKTK